MGVTSCLTDVTFHYLLPPFISCLIIISECNPARLFVLPGMPWQAVTRVKELVRKLDWDRSPSRPGL